MEAAELAGAVQEAVREGARRVLVAGGDGSVASAASVVANTGVELAIVPAGTLNHFARDYDIPLDVAAALEVAAGATVKSADAGYVNDQLFLNTSSVGAYVRFVKRRDSLKRSAGYHLASILASLGTLATSAPFQLELAVRERRHRYRTTLAFIGVGERELRIPVLGGRMQDGKRGLHVIVPRASSHSRLLIVAAKSALRGVQAAVGALELDSFMIDECRMELRRSRGDVALDGEISSLATPFSYRVARDALRVVTPR